MVSEYKKKYSREYYIKNKDTITKKNQEKIKCECGEELTRGQMYYHKNTLYHEEKLMILQQSQL